jgi:hypothetical protein
MQQPKIKFIFLPNVESKNILLSIRLALCIVCMYTSMTPIFLYTHCALLSVQYIHSTAAVFDSPFSRAHKNAQNRLNRQSVKKCFSLAPIFFCLTLFIFLRHRLIIFFLLYKSKFCAYKWMKSFVCFKVEY